MLRDRLVPVAYIFLPKVPLVERKNVLSVLPGYQVAPSSYIRGQVESCGVWVLNLDPW